MTPRTWLFVPGDSTAKIEKAAASDSDALILDLEDSVAPVRKSVARQEVAAALRTRQTGLQYWVRINPLGGQFAKDDLSAISSSAPDGIVLPKSESGTDVLELASLLAQIETQAGVGRRNNQNSSDRDRDTAFGVQFGNLWRVRVPTGRADMGGPRICRLPWGPRRAATRAGA